MRLLVTSDIHGQIQKVPLLEPIIREQKPDVLVVCGDLTHFGNLEATSSVLVTLRNLGLPVLFVPGNCDPKELESKAIFENTENLHGRCLAMSCGNIIGVGGCVPGPFRTPFELSEAEILQTLSNASKQCSDGSLTALISHSPPYGTKLDRTGFGQHVGSNALHDFVVSTSPTVVLCGHIHETRGTDVIGATTLLNPGPFYKGFYCLVELTEKVTVAFETLEKKG